jgi:hypothetical protein
MWLVSFTFLSSNCGRWESRRQDVGVGRRLGCSPKDWSQHAIRKSQEGFSSQPSWLILMHYVVVLFPQKHKAVPMVTQYWWRTRVARVLVCGVVHHNSFDCIIWRLVYKYQLHYSTSPQLGAIESAQPTRSDVHIRKIRCFLENTTLYWL